MMFTEILAAHVLDPMTSPPDRLGNHGRSLSSGTPPSASTPEIQPTGHLIRKSLGGHRITLQKVVNGKPHYIGPPGILV